MNALQRMTGRDRPVWFDVLDSWGAAGRPYREIADWLTGEQGLSAWWAQKLIVEYEQARGIRPPGIRRDGTFTVGASKSIAAPIERLVEALVDPGLRARWLPALALDIRVPESGRSVRFDVDGGPERLGVTFAETGEGRSQVAIEHERLPDPESAELAKASWRERLSTLQQLFEASRKAGSDD